MRSDEGGLMNEECGVESLAVNRALLKFNYASIHHSAIHSVGRYRVMSMIAAGRQWGPIIPKVKFGFGFRKSINVETKRVEICCQIIG
jgi:hypothetical protein